MNLTLSMYDWRVDVFLSVILIEVLLDVFEADLVCLVSFSDVIYLFV
jgi:hypothetical protein